MSNRLTKHEMQRLVEDIIFDAAISKAIEDNRELLKPSMQHFIDGGKVNGQFEISIKKLMRWVEKKTIEAITPLPPVQHVAAPVKSDEELKKEYLTAFGKYLIENWNTQEGEYWRNRQDDSELKTEDIIPLYLKSEWNLRTPDF